MKNNILRNSNLEFLRILSMILIIAYHYVIYGFNIAELDYSANLYIVGVLGLWGKLGVVCFVLISGYYMCKSKFTFRKFFKLEFEMLFYTITIALFFMIIDMPENVVSAKNIVAALFPMGYYTYWFMTNYIILMIISPLINIIINQISKSTYKKFLLLFIIMWSIIPSFTNIEYGFNSLSWFIVIYFIGGYIRNYVNIENHNANKHITMAGIFILLVVASNILLVFIGNLTSIDLLRNQSGRFSCVNSPFILVIAIELFVGCLKLKPHYNKFVNTVASATLGVYLLHENYILRIFLWKEIFNPRTMYESKYFILYAIGTILIIYAICTIVDLIRIATVEKLCFHIYDNNIDRIKHKCEVISRKITKLIKKSINWYYN